MRFSNSVVLRYKSLELSPIRFRDKRTYLEVRSFNKEWLIPWDATMPPEGLSQNRMIDPAFDSASAAAFTSFYLAAKKGLRDKSSVTLAIRVRGKFVGIISASNMVYGSARATQVGYWIDQRHSRKGLTTLAVALLTDYLFQERLMHRVEVVIRPENEPSLKIVAKLGFREEGMRPNYLHINGQWRDHRVFALHQEEFGTGLVNRLLNK